MTTIQVNDRCRITRPDNLNWELQVLREPKAKSNAHMALKANGREQSDVASWRTVGYYSTVPLALHAVLFNYPDLVVDCEGQLADVVDRMAKWHSGIMQLHFRELQNRHPAVPREETPVRRAA